MWICPVCDTKNSDNDSICRCCQTPRKPEPKPRKGVIPAVICAALLALVIGGIAAFGGQRTEKPAIVIPSSAPIPSESPVSAKNKCGENAWWELEDGVLTISGKGPMWDYEIGEYSMYWDWVKDPDTTPWYAEKDRINRVVVEDGVTAIGDHAFSTCSNIEYVSLPDTLISVGDFAFWGVKNYSTEFYLPDSVKSIGIGAFGDSTLETVGLPDGVTTIEPLTFQDCDLFGLAIPGTVVSVGAAFENCLNLERVYIPASVRYIDDNAFAGCDNLILCGLPGSYVQRYAKENGISFELSQGKCGDLRWEQDGDLLTISGNGPMPEFNDYDFVSPWMVEYSIGKLRIEKGVTSVTLMAFYFCVNIREVELPESLLSIAPMSFSVAGMTSISIPKSVKLIEGGAFEFCTNLRQVTFEGAETVLEEYSFSGIATDSIFYGYAGSSAEEYAKTNDISFEAFPAG